MAVRHGYGKVVTDGLVFAYDTGDTVNSYKGEPTTNLWDDILNTQSMRTHTKHYWDGRKWTEDATYTHPGVDGPEGVHLGIVFKHVSGAFTSSWSGNSYGYMLRDIACTSGATMTQSAWIYLSEDCNLDGVPSVIEQESGGESSVAGYPAEYNLNNKGTWQITAKKATSDGQVRFIPLYPRKNGTTVGEFTGFLMWALPQVTYGDHVVQPIQPGTTRSATEGLLDLTGTRNINIGSSSFTSEALTTFDGSGDYFDLEGDVVFKTSGGWTIEHIVKYDVVAGGYNNVTSPANFIGSDTNAYNSWYWSVLNNKLALWNKSPGIWKYGSTTLQPNTWYHTALVCSDDGTSYQMYLNGVPEGGDHTTYSWSAAHSGLRINYFGAGNSTLRYVNGTMPVTKIYDRVLTATEVKNNYGHYKTRFGI